MILLKDWESETFFILWPTYKPVSKIYQPCICRNVRVYFERGLCVWSWDPFCKTQVIRFYFSIREYLGGISSFNMMVSRNPLLDLTLFQYLFSSKAPYTSYCSLLNELPQFRIDLKQFCHESTTILQPIKATGKIFSGKVGRILQQFKRICDDSLRFGNDANHIQNDF